MTALYDAMEELREMGIEDGVRGCEHPTSARGFSEAGIGLRYLCDPARGGCGADLGPVGARR